MNVWDVLISIEPRRALAFLIGASIVIYALMSNLAWVNRVPRAGRYGRLLDWARRSRIARGFGESMRWLYYLAVPYGALMLGYTTMRALGVWGLDWVGTAIPFAIVGIGSLFVIVWVWRPYAQSEHPHAIDESGWNWARHIVELFYQQAHWAFYRSGPILWLGDFYWGSLFGLALTCLEAWTNPFVRANARDITRADTPLWSGGLAIISTTVFIFTMNTWYALIIHFIIDIGLRATIGFPRVHSPSDAPYN